MFIGSTIFSMRVKKIIKKKKEFLSFLKNLKTIEGINLSS